MGDGRGDIAYALQGRQFPDMSGSPIYLCALNVPFYPARLANPDSSRAGPAHIGSIRFLQGRPRPHQQPPMTILKGWPRTHRQHPMTIPPGQAPPTSAASDGNTSRASPAHIGSLRWQFLQGQPLPTSAASNDNSSRDSPCPHRQHPMAISPGTAPPTSVASNDNFSRAGPSHISSIRWHFLQGRLLPHQQHPMAIPPRQAPPISAASDGNSSRVGPAHIGSIQ